MPTSRLSTDIGRLTESIEAFFLNSPQFNPTLFLRIFRTYPSRHTDRPENSGSWSRGVTGSRETPQHLLTPGYEKPAADGSVIGVVKQA